MFRLPKWSAASPKPSDAWLTSLVNRLLLACSSVSTTSARSDSEPNAKPARPDPTSKASETGSSARRFLILGVGALALAVAAAFVYMNFIRGDAPPEFELSTSTDDANTDGPADESQALTAENISGSWLVAEGSQAGYRVVEDFVGGIQNFEAVGRTSEVSGSMTIDGTTASDVSITVDIASITSDSTKRDGQFSGPVMSADEFPTATFTLDDAIDFGSVPGDGTPVVVTGTGQLTLRGQTKQVNVAIDAQIVGPNIEVVGSTPIAFADFGIANPSIDGVLSIQDTGTVEFQLSFARN